MSLIAGNLAVVQKLLDGAHLNWGVFGGSAAHFYGPRRPINDIDILVPQGSLAQVAALLQQGQKAVQFDGGRILWRGIKLFDDLSIRQGGKTYPFVLDARMAEHSLRRPLLGSRVLMLAPEDVLVHKLLVYRGAEEGKYDIVDAEGIIKRQKLDLDYIRERIATTNAVELLEQRLAAHGVDLNAEPEPSSETSDA